MTDIADSLRKAILELKGQSGWAHSLSLMSIFASIQGDPRLTQIAEDALTTAVDTPQMPKPGSSKIQVPQQEGTQMKKTLAELESALDSATELAVLATLGEVQCATLLLCRLARDEYPTATRILLEPSDQGDWMSVDEILLADGKVVGGLEDDLGVPTHLYIEHLGSIPGLIGDTSPSWDGRQPFERDDVGHRGVTPDVYLIDIQAVLDEFEEE